jgi:hypothetical protein
MAFSIVGGGAILREEASGPVRLEHWSPFRWRGGGEGAQ